MRKILLSILVFVAACVSAQVTTTPAIIQVGYTGQVTVTFDPSKGDKGMVGATECYLYSCVEVDNSGSWEYQLAAWPSKSEKTKMTKNGNVWEITIPNLYTFYGVPSGKTITKILMLFTDGKSGGKSGRASGGSDIIIVLGQESGGDIWEAVESVAPITGNRPAGVSNGIYYGADGTSVTLCTYAASKTQPAKRVFLLGDMTDWKLKPEYQLKRDKNYFWITLTGLEKGKEYRFQYAVERADGVKKQICDLYSEKVLTTNDGNDPKRVDPTLINYPLGQADGGYVTVIQTSKPAFNWSNATLNFSRPNKDNLVIYELWVYDYTANRSFKGVMNRLDYIQNLGVNAIEFMPVTQYDCNAGWGYDPTLYFALDKNYGTPEDFKTLIDECHKRGIAVIVDFVFNHAYGQNPMNKLYPYGTDLASNPWFNVTPPEGGQTYGQDWNHDFAPAKEMFNRVFQYWLTEYKIDGFRLDLSHGLCGTTNNAVQNLIAYNNVVQSTSNGAYMILEHWGSGQQTLINEGMLCWTGEPLNHAHCQTAMGWLKPDDCNEHHTDGFYEGNKYGYVSYCESHDEERMQYKAKMYGNGDLKTNEAARIGRVAENVGFNVLLNGAHMIWQFSEIGYDYSIDHNGRTGTKPNPASLGYFTNASRVDAFTKCAQVNTLRTRLMPGAFTGTPSVNIGSKQVVRKVQWGNNIFAVANYEVTGNQTVTLPAGTWYDYFNGGTKASSTCTLAPGEMKVFTATSVKAPTFADIEKRDTQGVEGVQQEVKCTKILRDGQILILVGDKVYNLQGQRVR